MRDCVRVISCMWDFVRVCNSYMADSTGQPLDKIEEDTDRDFFMTPEEAMEYGIIDEVRTPSSFGASFGPCVAPEGYSLASRRGCWLQFSMRHVASAGLARAGGSGSGGRGKGLLRAGRLRRRRWSAVCAAMRWARCSVRIAFVKMR